LTNIIKNIKNSYAHIPYTSKHIVAFCKCEKNLTGKFRFKSMFHDADKLLMYAFLPFLGTNTINNIHRWYSSHHKRTHKDILSMVIDWESARFTKPDKPLNAYQTLYVYCPELEYLILPKLKELNLV